MLLNQTYSAPLRRIRAISRIRRQIVCLAVVLLVVLSSTGCAQTTKWFSRSSELVAPQLEVVQISPFGQPGGYKITGRTSLPDQTQVTVSAIRYLQTSGQSISNPDSSYSVLARQFAPVEQGTWEANLTLWQVAPDGRFQEVWQLNQGSLGIQVEPDPNVTFLVTLDPANQSATLQDQLESQGEASTGSLVQFNADGELYLQASKTMMVALPTGGTTPPTDQTNDAVSSTPSSSGVTSASPPALSPTQTDTPIPSNAFIR
ncbi:MAG: hypothetical protein HC840_16365 [Leptolyngbyaceae cyanobacterium RM2_2_4]|nr:hypothetical protein [Leptolyngbyaceae cyanobacterium SM1_4_3]NJN55997.1 hypothetical protein [Leptolyngbyaceae cyanobacterium SL_5_9]NJO50754.1 hypothetical protein [Leptolyngbyaceae cyanobacterium RM2_2_4]